MFWYRLSSHYKRDFHWLLYLEEFCFSVISFNWLKLPKVTWCMTSKNYFSYLLKLFSNLYLGKKKREWILISGKFFGVPVCSTYCMEIAGNYKWPWLHLANCKTWLSRCPLFCFVLQQNPRNERMILLFISILNMTRKITVYMQRAIVNLLFSKAVRSLDSDLLHQ